MTALKTRTRIVCTLGPATDRDDVLRTLILNGMDVARVNFSHGDHATHTRRIERVRNIARDEGAVVAILADLQGPKIRVGELADGRLDLDTGATLVLTSGSEPGTGGSVPIDFPNLAAAVGPGNLILLDDGLIELTVTAVQGSDVVTRVVNGGTLLPRKGVNLPGIPVKASAITDKDRADLEFAVELQVDYVALSFVRCADDILELKRLLAARGNLIPVIAKIEKPEAVSEIDAIIDIADGIMVARGDLGVELPPASVPLQQKAIIRKANAAGKPVITATQMLESMITHPRPTRAEASDVANAILDGTDAVMLSGETAVGAYPVEAALMMEQIARTVEKEVAFRPSWREDSDAALAITDAIGTATCEIAQELGARVILTATFSGSTARMISRHRPQTPIFAVTTSVETQRRLALVWGVECVVVPPVRGMEGMVAQSLAAALEHGVVANGDVVVVTAGVPVGAPGRTNMLQVRVVGENQ